MKNTDHKKIFLRKRQKSRPTNIFEQIKDTSARNHLQELCHPTWLKAVSSLNKTDWWINFNGLHLQRGGFQNFQRNQTKKQFHSAIHLVPSLCRGVHQVSRSSLFLRWRIPSWVPSSRFQNARGLTRRYRTRACVGWLPSAPVEMTSLANMIGWLHNFSSLRTSPKN